MTELELQKSDAFADVMRYVASINITADYYKDTLSFDKEHTNEVIKATIRGHDKLMEHSRRPSLSGRVSTTRPFKLAIKDI